MKVCPKQKKTICSKQVRRIRVKRRPGIFNSAIFFINMIFALVMGMALVVPYVPVTLIPTLSTISLLVPVLVCAHIIFVLFWMAKKRKGLAVLSILILILWYVVLGPFYNFSDPSEESGNGTLTIMSFNSRRFNEHGQLDIEDVDSLILDFVSLKNPDILCFQECHYEMKQNNALGQYPYKYIDDVYGKSAKRAIQAVYSKYPIVNRDSILFPKSSNSAVYADILYKEDTIRVYNVHLQSFRIIPGIDAIKNQESPKLLKRSGAVMSKQYGQAVLIRDHIDGNRHKKIVAGDFNNTQYSNIYKTIKGDLQDTFLEKGKGFGRTYDLLGFPIRIDYILADPAFEVVSHRNFDEKLSDHYPVMATLRLKPDK